MTARKKQDKPTPHCQVCGSKLIPRIYKGSIVYDCSIHGEQGSYNLR